MPSSVGAKAAPRANAAAPRVGVLALQGAVAEHTAVLRRLGAETVLVRRPAQLDGLDGLVVPGGESTAIARLAQPLGLLPSVRAQMDRGMAVLGTCAGLVLLSDRIVEAETEAATPVDATVARDAHGRGGAFDGLDRIGGLHVAARRNGYGRHRESFEAVLEVSSDLETGPRMPPGSGARTPMRAAFIRAPMIEDVGAGVDVIARHRNRPVAVRQGRVVAATFHPEITGEDGLHRLFLQMAAERAVRLPSAG